MATSWTGGIPHRAGLAYHDNLPSGISALSAPVGLEFGYDNIGRLSTMDWNAVPSVSGMTALADYGWVGGLRQRRTVQYDSSADTKGQSDFTYDAYHRLHTIEDTVWMDASTTHFPSNFEYEYDEVHNLLKEHYDRVDGSKGDRFAYDEFHRLEKAWMGVDSTTMTAANDPTGWASSGMHEYLTYGLDGVNNRTSAERYTSSTPLVETYTLQGSGHPQGPSNRYASVAGFGLSSAATYAYDDRGNLKYDGRFFYRYDYLNRLQAVWRLKLVDEEEEEGERLLVVEREALDEACAEVERSVPDLLSRLPREHTDPTFRSRLKARLRGGVIRLIPEGARRAGGCWAAGTLVDDADVDLVAVYGYDHWNRRTVTVVVEPGLADTGFHVFDGWRQVAQHTLHVSGSAFYAVPTKQFVWGARLDEMLAYRRRVVVSSVVSWEVYYVLHGGQDTAARLVDAGGVVRERYEYDPYGMVKVYSGTGSYLGGPSPLGLAFLWKAVRLDAETGLLYMRNRYYSTGLGRFLTRDPIGVWGDPLDWGCEYGYAGVRHLVIGDPYGLQGQYGDLKMSDLKSVTQPLSLTRLKTLILEENEWEELNLDMCRAYDRWELWHPQWELPSLSGPSRTIEGKRRSVSLRGCRLSAWHDDSILKGFGVKFPVGGDIRVSGAVGFGGVSISDGNLSNWGVTAATFGVESGGFSFDAGINDFGDISVIGGYRDSGLRIGAGFHSNTSGRGYTNPWSGSSERFSAFGPSRGEFFATIEVVHTF